MKRDILASRAKAEPFLPGGCGPSPMRICHVISGDLWAGAEAMTFELIKQLNRRKDSIITALIMNEGRLAEELRRLGIEVQVVAESGRSFLSLLRSAGLFIRSRSPQILHSHRYKENILTFFCARGEPRACLVATQHGMPECGYRKTKVFTRFANRLNWHLLGKRFDQLVAVSLDIRERLVMEHGFRAVNVRVIHNGIDLPERQERLERSGPIVVGSAGRLFAVKDFPLLIEVARLVGYGNTSLKFEIAGDGPERSHLERLVSDYGLEGKVRLLGQVDKMSRFYERIDLYVNTSHHEGIPMSIIEAMAHGVPVIAPNVGGIGEIIDDGKDGFLVNVRNPQGFAEKCVQLMDSATRRRMGSAARAKVERSFSAERMGEEYFRLYQQMADF